MFIKIVKEQVANCDRRSQGRVRLLSLSKYIDSLFFPNLTQNLENRHSPDNPPLSLNFPLFQILKLKNIIYFELSEKIHLKRY